MSTILPEETEAVGQMVYEAFREIAERHNYPPAFPNPELAQLIVRLLAQTEGYESYLLTDGGKPVAANFGDERDDVIGVGPVAVAVEEQGHGFGRRVMEALLERADESGYASVRLIQSAYNLQSFSLYHKLGFDVKGLLANAAGRPPAGAEPVDRVREYTHADLDECDALHRDVLGISRRHDIEFMAAFAPPVIVERDGRIAGYQTRFPGETTFLTHGVARDEAALRDGILGTARLVAEPLQFTMPTAQAETLRWLMANGFDIAELDSYMVRGEYQEPMGAWIPSPFY